MSVYYERGFKTKCYIMADVCMLVIERVEFPDSFERKVLTKCYNIMADVCMLLVIGRVEFPDFFERTIFSYRIGQQTVRISTP